MPKGLPRAETAWLAHIDLLAGLPHPAPTLMPTVLAAIRSGFDADFGILDWAASDLSALPPQPRQMVERLLGAGDGVTAADCELSLAAGNFHFRAERLHDMSTGAVQAAVTISHLEPTDIAVARRLLGWPLSPREKRLIVASVHQPSHQDLAAELGITVGTLKSYINKFQARLDVASRQDLIDRVLAVPAPGSA